MGAPGERCVALGLLTEPVPLEGDWVEGGVGVPGFPPGLCADATSALSRPTAVAKMTLCRFDIVNLLGLVKNSALSRASV